MTHIAVALQPEALKTILTKLDEEGSTYLFTASTACMESEVLFLEVEGEHSPVSVELNFDGTWKAVTVLVFGD